MSVYLQMASSNRGQLPARHTKVVDESQCPLKTDSLGNDEVCGNDVLSSKPCSQGRGEIDVSQTCNVSHTECCGTCSSKCKTCHHFVESSTLTSNVTRKTYSVSSPEGCMNCGTRSVIYLITCI